MIYSSFLASREFEDKQQNSVQYIVEYTLEWECTYNMVKNRGALKEGQMKSAHNLATSHL